MLKASWTRGKQLVSHLQTGMHSAALIDPIITTPDPLSSSAESAREERPRSDEHFAKCLTIMGNATGLALPLLHIILSFGWKSRYGRFPLYVLHKYMGRRHPYGCFSLYGDWYELGDCGVHIDTVSPTQSRMDHHPWFAIDETHPLSLLKPVVDVMAACYWSQGDNTCKFGYETPICGDNGNNLYAMMRTTKRHRRLEALVATPALHKDPETVFRYTPSIAAWTALPQQPPCGDWMGLWVNNGIVCFGTDEDECCDKVYLYEDEIWKLVYTTPPGKSIAAVVPMSLELIILLNSDHSSVTDDVHHIIRETTVCHITRSNMDKFRFEVKWSKPCLTPRSSVHAVRTSPSTLLMCGGYDRGYWRQSEISPYYNVVEEYNSITGNLRILEWILAPEIRDIRTLHYDEWMGTLYVIHDAKVDHKQAPSKPVLCEQRYDAEHVSSVYKCHMWATRDFAGVWTSQLLSYSPVNVICLK